MMVKNASFDAARDLASPESQAEVLNRVPASGDAGYVARAAWSDRAGLGYVGELAREARATREALYKALSGNGDPRLTTLLGVARALGVTLTARIEPVG
jgi:probable addiction module antidote protein